ncbi:hypothetical protein [Cystobacter fuscus]|uniref:hypothetical protein n=1 Tax=Cystobacter fuscus TaxID=43 RepID=UPI0037BE5B51
MRGLSLPHVTGASPYAITPLGRTLAGTVDALRQWAEQHIDEVARAQEHFDARP